MPLPGYDFHELIQNGGSAIATDTSPASADPPDSRVVAIPSTPPPAGQAFVFHPLDGTSITVAIWILCEKLGVWLPYKAATAAATASAPVVMSVAGFAVPPGARVFVQVTANTGVTRLGWRYC